MRPIFTLARPDFSLTQSVLCSWNDFGRARGTTCLWTEGWFHDGDAWQWSYYANRLRGAADLAPSGDVTFGGYIVGREASAAGLAQKALALAGSGAKSLRVYTFGPEYMFKGNSYSEHSDIFAAITRALNIIGAAESALFPGRRPVGQVAIMYPRSSFIWDEWGIQEPTTIEDETNFNMDGRTTTYLAEIHGLFALLAQTLNYQVDFIDEDITSSKLGSYKVVFVTEPCLPVESQRTLREYAAKGGTVVLTNSAAMLDRYGQPSMILGQHIDSVKPSSAAITSVWSLPTTANGTFVDAAGSSRPFVAFGPVGRAAVKLPEGSKVLATFSDGTAAAVAAKVKPVKLMTELDNVAVSEGTVIRIMWQPGLSWDHSGWLAGSGVFLETIIASASVSRLAWTNASSCVHSTGGVERGIETPLLLDGSNGAAMTLLNWCHGNVTIEASALVGFTVGSVVSAATGASLSFSQLAGQTEPYMYGRVAVHVTVADVDVLVFHPRGRIKTDDGTRRRTYTGHSVSTDQTRSSETSRNGARQDQATSPSTPERS